MSGDGVQVRWFGDGDNAKPWAMLHDLPDDTRIRFTVGGPEAFTRCAAAPDNAAVLIVAWPDGSVPQPPTIDVQWLVVDARGTEFLRSDEVNARECAAEWDHTYEDYAPHRVERREVHR